MFCAMLGTVAGSLAVTFRAQGGIHIAGGIVPRIRHYVAQSGFRERFESMGRFRQYVEAIPTSVILNPDMAFAGLKQLALRMTSRPADPR
jgi:glucokinase